MSSDREAALERRWKGAQEHLGFTDEELATYRSFPKNVKAMEQGRTFATHQMVVEVTEARNCAAGYRVGDRFLVDSQGCLVAEECPPRLCAAAIWALKPLVDRMWEAFFQGATEILHDTVRCPDVGVSRGGAGEVTLRIRAVPRPRPGTAEKAQP